MIFFPAIVAAALTQNNQTALDGFSHDRSTPGPADYDVFLDDLRRKAVLS